MSLDLGEKLAIRSMVYVAAERIPFFWPMRSFIHHNPLHGLEQLPFAEAVRNGEDLFHAQGFLTRRQYQAYLAQGKVDRDTLTALVARFQSARTQPAVIDWQRWLVALLTETPDSVTQPVGFAEAEQGEAKDIQAALAGRPVEREAIDIGQLVAVLEQHLLGDQPVSDAVDALYGTAIGDELDELLIKVCLDFFDEGQSVWGMPERDQGLFSAWRALALRNLWPSRRNRRVRQLLALSDEPEVIIAQVLKRFGVPEEHWMGYFSRKLARLHGWSGFIRWRSSAAHYHWQQRFPSHLVDFIAVRMTLAAALMAEQQRYGRPHNVQTIAEMIRQRPKETYLRYELQRGDALPAFGQRLEQTLAVGKQAQLDRLFDDYVQAKREHQALQQAGRLRRLADAAGESGKLAELDSDGLGTVLQGLREFERDEGIVWLRAMEARAMDHLLAGVRLRAEPHRDKRPFVQALFCIDTRSERIRRQLEGVGDYQTFGIAGFFGVPVSFMELGKGSEQHLCPVLLTPKNLVIEMSTAAPTDQAAVTALEKAAHDLKESVLTPFVTVEAIGLLFGFDMVGKTVAPRGYHRWRNRLHQHKPPTHLLLDKLTEDQADSIVRAAQRAVIVKAVELELGLQAEQVNDDLIRALRETALGPEQPHDDQQPTDAMLDPRWCAELGLTDAGRAFIQRLRDGYRITRRFARRQCEQLGRIGFTLDQQANFVLTALTSIGLNQGFSRFVLLIGHGSQSENNPYESALDCGACGGAHGLVSARVLAQMANKAAVRERLRVKGVTIPDDAWFVPALHNTTTDQITLVDLERLPPSHLVYLDRLRSGLTAASRLCAQERIPGLNGAAAASNPTTAALVAQRNSLDWSQVRPEWGLSGNAYFVIGRREVTRALNLDGRAFLHSYDYRLDPKRRLLESILTGPLVVGQWINMEHYFSTVDNERFGSGSKAYHNVAGRFGVMSGNLSDLRTGLPAQTVLNQGQPYHQPMRLITVIEAPFEQARRAIEAVVSVKQLVRNGWIRVLVLDPQARTVSLYEDSEWQSRPLADDPGWNNPEMGKVA